MIELLAVSLLLLGGSCGRREASAPVPATPDPVSPPSAVSPYGAESLEAFRLKVHQMIVAKDAEAYRMLHCWDMLPPQIQALLAGNRQLSLPVFEYSEPQVSVEPMTEVDLNQAMKSAAWNINPSHWLIVRGEGRGQFSTWELGEYQGRFYFANRKSPGLTAGGETPDPGTHRQPGNPAR